MQKNILRLLPFLVYFCSAYLTFIVVEEDAFIYFRIAQNMADGHGIVFNAGGEHIESGSGLTWQLMLAVIAMLPVHLVIATKCLGVLFACLSLAMLLRLSDRLIEDKRFVIFPALFLAASTPFYYWSHRGLETPLFVFALLWLADWLIDSKKIQWWYAPAFFVFCSRPEGFLMVAAVMPWLWFERNRINHFWRGAGIFMALVMVVECWRLWYFHDLLPHAFYQKIGGDTSRSFKDILTYSLWNGLPWLLLFSMPPLFKKTNWNRSYIPLLLLIAVTTFWAIIGADWKSFNRQLSSWLPFVFLFVMIGIDRMYPAGTSKTKTLMGLALYGFLLFMYSPYTTTNNEVKSAPNNVCLTLFLKDPVGYHRYLWNAVRNPDGYFTQKEPTLAGDHIGFNRNATVGRFIQLNYPQGITVIFDQMGQETWYAGLDKRFVDNTGLTDKQIGYFIFQEKARQSMVFGLYEKILLALKNTFWPEEPYYITKPEIVERLFAEHAALILVREKYVENQPNSILGLMYQDKRFGENYREIYRVNKRDTVYQRRDLPVNLHPIVPAGALVEFNYKDNI